MDKIIEQAREERRRQADLPGSECDAKNTPGDWVAMISHYAGSEVRRNGMAPNAEEFQETLIKAAAVIFATLEYIDDMKERNELL